MNYPKIYAIRSTTKHNQAKQWKKNWKVHRQISKQPNMETQ